MKAPRVANIADVCGAGIGASRADASLENIPNFNEEAVVENDGFFHFASEGGDERSSRGAGHF